MLYNGRLYVGGYSLSEEATKMLGVLGVKVTPTVAQKLLPYVGKAGGVFYSSSVQEASGDTLLALKAQASCAKLLPTFTPAPASVEAWEAWQALENGASQEERASMAAAEAAARAIEAEHGLPAGSIKLPTAAKAGKGSIAAAEDARAAYVVAVVGQFKQHLRLGTKPKAVSEYATTHFAATANMAECGIAEASVTLPTTRKGNGNGSRRGFLKPTEVAGISWAGSWKATASQLLAAGVVVDGNFSKRPALGRCARELKDKSFTFEHGTFTGAHVLANLEAFRTPQEEGEEATA